MKATSLLMLVLAGGAMVGAVVLAPSRSSQVIGQYATPLDHRSRNQVHNAQLSSQKLDGALIPPGGEFSFNHAIGSWSRDNGYRRAPVSYDGRLIDDWGGGVCQTSTTLYNAALLAGMEVLERHPHHFAPEYAPPGRDAAVAYGSFDLRLRNPYSSPVRIGARIRNGRLHVSLTGVEGPAEPIRIESAVTQGMGPITVHLEPSGRNRVRSEGKAGVSVTVTRLIGDRRERISADEYPTMHRVVEGNRL